MSPLRTLSIVTMLAVGVASCTRPARAQIGGEREGALAAATSAHDVTKVRELLASGANPDALVPGEGPYHSPWELALKQVRPGRTETIDIVKAMLKAGASPHAAWGESFVRGLNRRCL
jgi:hypothetical protein